MATATTSTINHLQTRLEVFGLTSFQMFARKFIQQGKSLKLARKKGGASMLTSRILFALHENRPSWHV
jgi:hypothetical protein